MFVLSYSTTRGVGGGGGGGGGSRSEFGLVDVLAAVGLPQFTHTTNKHGVSHNIAAYPGPSRSANKLCTRTTWRVPCHNIATSHPLVTVRPGSTTNHSTSQPLNHPTTRYSTVKQINIALETRLLDLQCEIEQQRAMTSAAQQDSAAAATAADAPDAGATDADAADADDVDIATDA